MYILFCVRLFLASLELIVVLKQNKKAFTKLLSEDEGNWLLAALESICHDLRVIAFLVNVVSVYIFVFCL